MGSRLRRGGLRCRGRRGRGICRIGLGVCVWGWRRGGAGQHELVHQGGVRRRAEVVDQARDLVYFADLGRIQAQRLQRNVQRLQLRLNAWRSHRCSGRRSSPSRQRRDTCRSRVRPRRINGRRNYARGNDAYPYGRRNIRAHRHRYSRQVLYHSIRGGRRKLPAFAFAMGGPAGVNSKSAASANTAGCLTVNSPAPCPKAWSFGFENTNSSWRPPAFAVLPTGCASGVCDCAGACVSAFCDARAVGSAIGATRFNKLVNAMRSPPRELAAQAQRHKQAPGRSCGSRGSFRSTLRVRRLEHRQAAEKL